jgi:hypothetical protein
LSNDRGLGDESKKLHRGIASGTGQRVDLVDAIDELGPSLAHSATWRRGVVGGFGWRGGVCAVGGSNAIGVGTVEMDPVFFRLRNVDEETAPGDVDRLRERAVRIGQALERRDCGLEIEASRREPELSGVGADEDGAPLTTCLTG